MHTQFLVFLALVSASALAGPASRPMKEMHGGCADYRLRLREELATWDEVAISAGALPRLPIGLKVKVNLAKQGTEFLATPGKKFEVEGDAHGGVFPFEVPESGTWRVSAGAKLWLDVVERASREGVKEKAFEMQTGCEKIFKVVEFSLKKGVPYVLQVSSSAKPEAFFLITKRP